MGNFKVSRVCDDWCGETEPIGRFNLPSKLTHTRPLSVSSAWAYGSKGYVWSYSSDSVFLYINKLVLKIANPCTGHARVPAPPAARRPIMRDRAVACTRLLPAVYNDFQPDRLATQEVIRDRHLSGW